MIIKIVSFFLLFSLLFSKEYFISFRMTSLNLKIVNLSFNCSRVMVNRNCKKKFLFKIKIKKPFKCDLYAKRIINKLYGGEINVFWFEKIDKTVYNKEVLVFFPKLFFIKIEKNEAYFYMCKGDNN